MTAGGRYDELAASKDVEEQKEGPAPSWRLHLFGGRSSSDFFSICLVASAIFILMTFLLLFFSSFSAVSGVAIGKQASSSSSTPPDYFQTSLGGPFAGPTKTAEAPFLASSNPAPFPSKLYIPNTPLETQAPITGNTNNSNIFELHGYLSHYFPSPGFGVEEFALPEGSNVSYVYMLHRHGARYPTEGSVALMLATKLQQASGKFTAKGNMAFLNTWTNKLGTEILVPVGKQELFDSGTLHYYQYGHLYPNNGSKIIARSTTQDRMIQSAEYFLSGFFGLQWPQNATLELIIEASNFNNTLAGYYKCPNSHKSPSQTGQEAGMEWSRINLANATTRIQEQIDGLDWTVIETFAAQEMCAYETVALGFSSFCGLFTYEEWLGYSHAVDLYFSGNNAFQSPTGRAIGIGYVQEVLARIEHRTINQPTAQVNVTLDSDPSTFPIDQRLNFDFSHDTNIMSILTAFGLKQFSAALPTTHMIPHELVVSHLEPFAARLDIEVIEAPEPVSPVRKKDSFQYIQGKPTKYIHFILNQRTVPLGKSFPECGDRTDGWCELSAFLEVQKDSLREAQYEYSCFGEYDSVPYGTLTNGVPPPKR